jgi:glyoxylase-like metal-dependent hydrolase (beta-lactamase superfamily II)
MRLSTAAAIVASVVGAATVMAQQPPLVRALTEPWWQELVIEGIAVLPVRGNVFMLDVDGTNVTVVTGPEVIVVDSGPSGRSTALLAAIRRLTPQPVRYLINTGPDRDHVGGNAAIVQAAGGIAGPGPGGPGGQPGQIRYQNVGIRTVAHENAVMHMTSSADPVTGDGVPDATFFSPRRDLFVNGEGVQVLWQQASRTDGDVFVHFRGSDVIAAGDVYVTDTYPRIDRTRGGTVQGELDALTTLLEIAIPERNQMGGTLIVPGHGRLSNEADVVEYRDMLTIVRDRVREMVGKGMTLEQVKAAAPTLEYDVIYGKNREWTGEMFLEAVYRDLSGGK